MAQRAADLSMLLQDKSIPCRQTSQQVASVGPKTLEWLLQGYYRRADALYALGKIKQAYADFKRAAKVAPKDPDLRKKLLECEKEVKRIRFEEALSLPVST